MASACCFSQIVETSADQGVYLTKDDFESKRLSFPFSERGDQLVELRRGKVLLIRGELELEFSFGNIYGYRVKGCDFVKFGKQGVFRLYGYYQILDYTPLVVYFKRTVHGKYIYTNQPFFSLALASEKHSLTVYHLKRHAAISPQTVHVARWFKRHLPSLATQIENKCIINILLVLADYQQSHFTNGFDNLNFTTGYHSSALIKKRA